MPLLIVRFTEFTLIRKCVYKLLLQTRTHSHAVFKLVKITVELIIGHFPLSRKIEFVRRIHYPVVILFKHHITEKLQRVYRLACGFFVEKLQLRQLVPESRYTYRHAGHALYRRVKHTKVGQRFLKFLAVIKSGTKHYLCIYLNPCRRHFIKIIKALSCIRIFSQLYTKFRISRMHRNIHRQLHLYNSVNILVAEICHSNIVALQKTQT